FFDIEYILVGIRDIVLGVCQAKMWNIGYGHSVFEQIFIGFARIIVGSYSTIFFPVAQSSGLSPTNRLALLDIVYPGYPLVLYLSRIRFINKKVRDIVTHLFADPVDDLHSHNGRDLIPRTIECKTVGGSVFK